MPCWQGYEYYLTCRAKEDEGVSPTLSCMFAGSEMEAIALVQELACTRSGAALIAKKERDKCWVRSSVKRCSLLRRSGVGRLKKLSDRTMGHGAGESRPWLMHGDIPSTTAKVPRYLEADVVPKKAAGCR